MLENRRGDFIREEFRGERKEMMEGRYELMMPPSTDSGRVPPMMLPSTDGAHEGITPGNDFRDGINSAPVPVPPPVESKPQGFWKNDRNIRALILMISK